MKFLKRLLMVLAIIGIGLVLLSLALRPDNRLSYKGQSLDTWLNKFGSRPVGGGLSHSKLSAAGRGADKSAGVAIRAIGTNAIAPLMKAMTRRADPGWLKQTKAFLAKIKLATLVAADAESRREQAALAMFELGTNAAPALPALSRLLTNYATAAIAAHALAGMGPTAMPAFQMALTNSDKWINDCGVWGLAQIGPAAREAVPQVLPLLGAANSADVHITTWALGEIREPAEVVVPALVGLLNHSDKGVRLAAIQALTKYGPVITNQIPLLKLQLEKEMDSGVLSDLKKLIADTEKLENPVHFEPPAAPPASP